MNNNYVTIVDDGQSLDVPQLVADEWVNAGFIFKCDDKQCCGMYHLSINVRWTDVPEYKSEPDSKVASHA